MRSTKMLSEVATHASGIVLPSLRSIARQYHLVAMGASDRPVKLPTPIPRNARPPSPGEKPLCSWNTMGKAAKKAYSVAYAMAM